MLRTVVFLSYLPLLSCVLRWEERTLKCDVNDCQLALRNDTFQKAACTQDADSHHSCDIKCDGADRDSVISKSPTTNRHCIRFYTYNTNRVNGGWHMWRLGLCANQSIILQVHCGFLDRE